MEAPEQPMIEALAIFPRDVVADKIVGTGRQNGFLLNIQSDFDEANSIINREGYRYRIVLIDLNAIDDVKKWVLETSPVFPWLCFAILGDGWIHTGKLIQKYDSSEKMENLESNLPVAFRSLSGNPDPDTVIEIALDLLYETRNMLPSLPPPPYQESDTRSLREIGPMLFSISLVERPWKLEGDAFTLPVSAFGELGNLGEAWIRELGEYDEVQLGNFIKNIIPKNKLQPSRPVYGDFSYLDGSITRTIKLILATSSTLPQGTVASAVEASLATIDLATSLSGCKTLILPIIGGGTAGLAPEEIIRGALEEFDPKTPLGELKHVIFTVYEPEVFEAMVAPREIDIRLVQRLENDLPSGPDRLRVESETYALADAIALHEMEPPLVVGIFGGWGTGKSFVLHLIKQRLRQLRNWDLSDEKTREKFPYVGHPYIVHFDAWTYAKSDLWASLMQRILLDLDKQISLEQNLLAVRPEILLQGVDIWGILEKLTARQLSSLKEELGQEAIERLQDWRKGEHTADELWNVITRLRNEEIEKLKEERDNLSKKQKKYAEKISKKQIELDNDIEQEKRKQSIWLETEEADSNRQLAAKRAAIQSARRKAAADADAEIERISRNDAWVPVVDELKAFLGGSLDKAIKSTALEQGDAPPSIFTVAKQLKGFTRYWKGLTESRSGIAFLAFALVSPLLAWLLVKININELVSGISGSAGVIGGVLASKLNALKKFDGRLRKSEEDYKSRTEKIKADRSSQREQIYQYKISQTVLPIENTIAELESNSKKNREDYRIEGQKKLDKLISDRRKQLENLRQEQNDDLQELRSKVDNLVRRAGISGRSDSILELIQERKDSKFYDEQCGVLHQIQEDLKEVTEALLLVDESYEKWFPRGGPRIILIIDDLDRCPPDQVVQVLEAVQLLVKTRLFVVVLAMDVRYVTRALEKKYEHVLVRDGDPSGLDYIEKIVQIPYRVPGIAPGVMRSFLQGQMTVVERRPDTARVMESPDMESTPEARTPQETENPVFKSSHKPGDSEPKEPLPTHVQQFDEQELSILTECCNEANVNPRAGRRLVNVFKLLKIIWYHRGLHREPAPEVKRMMLFLLALSSKQPVIMRHVLHLLEEEYRVGDPRKNLKQVILDSLKSSETYKKQPKTHHLLRDLIKKQRDFSKTLTLERMALENVRLVKSFSFVGEVSDVEDSHNMADKETTSNRTSVRDTTQRKSVRKKAGVSAKSRKD